MNLSEREFESGGCLDVVERPCDMTPDAFFRDFWMQHRAVLVRRVFDDCSCALSGMPAFGSGADFLKHPLVADIPAEVSCQRSGEVMTSWDDPATNDGTTALDAAALLSDGTAESTDRVARYVKVALTDVEQVGLMVVPFMNDEPLVPVQHPMMLRPGGFFCWAFVGDAGSGSKTHVDVMGSDAWLVVIKGRKQWALCHPADKHLVVNDSDGTFANLLDIDPVLYPNAHKARIAYFVQEEGDAIFVPGDAPHTVLNLSASTSITFNFMKGRRDVHRVWHHVMQRVVGEDESGGILDLLLVDEQPRNTGAPATTFAHAAIAEHSHSADVAPVLTFRSMTVRTYLPGALWRCAEKSEGSRCAMFLDDYGARVCLESIHTALRDQHGTMFSLGADAGSALRSVGVPIGFDEQTRGDRRAQVVFAVKTPSFEELLSRCAMPSVSANGDVLWKSLFYQVQVDAARPLTNLVPTQMFTSMSSHVGMLPNFPPLSVLLQQSWFFETSWNLKPLANVFQMRWKARTPCGAESFADSELNAASEPMNVARSSMWHYSRFPWEAPPCKPPAKWRCSTYLFYSSPFLAGPLSLFPLTTDATLQSADGLQGARQRPSKQALSPVPFTPHFQEFQWDMTALTSPLEVSDESVLLGVIELGEDVERELLMKLLLTPGGPGFLNFCSQHAPLSIVAGMDWSTCGIEKLAILALYFGTRPAVVGFTYSYKFRFVNEPSTLCLIGSAAQQLLHRVADSRLAKLLTEVAAWLEGGDTIVLSDVPVTVIALSTALSVSQVDLFAWLCSATRIKQQEATSYHPESDGTASRQSEISRVQLMSRRCTELLDILSKAAKSSAVVAPES